MSTMSWTEQRADDEQTAPDGGREKRNAYEIVAAKLRGQIISGERLHGDRLPNESDLAGEFGVSRATVREALRVLTAQDIIRTAKGAGGGSYVQVPSVRHISEFLHSSINLLMAAQFVTVEELLEAREFLEVPAARLAAERRAKTDIERLRHSIHASGDKVDAAVEFAYNTDFHVIILETCGNTLLSVAAQPVFNVLMTGFERESLGARFHQAVRRQHRDIADAIDKGDGDAAGGLMYDHLEYLRPTYERLWEQARRKRR
jgi:DNA-binding FadR family transcriptional regulator